MPKTHSVHFTAFAVGFAFMSSVQASDCLQQLRTLDRQLSGLSTQTENSTTQGGLTHTLSERELARVNGLRETAEVLYYAGSTQACTDTVRQARKMLMASNQPGLVSVNKIIGYKIKDPQNNELGEIRDVILDVNEDHIAYVIIAFGGFLGMGEDLSPVPFSALVPAVEEEAFVLSISADKLEKAPRYSAEKMPEMDDPKWGKSIFNYYGRRPYWEDGTEILAEN